jgi:hypothetical protein
LFNNTVLSKSRSGPKKEIIKVKRCAVDFHCFY